MSLYYLQCIKTTERKNLKVVETKIGSIMLLPKSAVCNNKKVKFIKEQQARRLLSNLGIRTPLSQILLLVPLLF